MKKSIVSLLVACVFILPAVAQKGGVAILDIDAVAKQLGVEEKVRVDLLNIQNSLNAELQKAQTTMQTQMNGVEKAAGEKPTEEQRKQIVATNQQLNDEFNRMKSQAQQNLAQERVRMISEFRTRLEPIALKAAKAIGLEVVVMKNAPVFAFDASVDITQETTRLALEAGMQVQPSALAPAVPAPAASQETPESGAGGPAKTKE